jgi:hypothetical protein
LNKQLGGYRLQYWYYITDTSLYFRGGVSFINRRYSAAESVIATVKNIATTLPTATVKEDTLPTVPASERREFPTQAPTPASKRKSANELEEEPIAKKRQDGLDTVSTVPASERREFPTQAPTPVSIEKEPDTSLLQRLLHIVLLYIDANNLYGVRT